MMAVLLEKLIKRFAYVDDEMKDGLSLEEINL